MRCEICEITTVDYFIVNIGPDPEEIRKEEITNKIKKIKNNYGGNK